MLLYVWRLHDIFSILRAVPLFTLVSVACVVLYVLNGYPRRSLRRLRHPIFWLVCALLALLVLSVPFSLYQGASFRFVVNDHAKILVVMILLTASIRDLNDLERFLWVNVFGAAVTAVTLLTIAERNAQGRLELRYYYDANDLALILVMTLPLMVYLLRRHSSRALESLFVVGAIVISLAGIAATGSRGGFLALLAVLSFMLVAYRSLSVRTRVLAVTVAAAALAVAGTDQFWARMNTMLHPAEDYNWVGRAESGRLEVWKRGLGYMIDRPFTGVGASAYAVAEGTISEMARERGYGVQWTVAHNSFIQVGAELGVPALLVFIALLYITGRTCWRISRQSGTPGGQRSPPNSEAVLAAALLAILTGYLVGGFFLSQAYNKFLYMLFGFVIALDWLATRRFEGVGHREAPVNRRRRKSGLRSAGVPQQ